MADDVSITPGSGAVIATDDIGGRQHQLVKLVTGGDGVSEGMVSTASPMPTRESGELVEAIEALRMAVQSLVRTSGQVMPDVAGRQRVVLDAITSALTLSTLSNQTYIGGVSATEQIPSLMRLGADSLRRNISVT